MCTVALGFGRGKLVPKATAIVRRVEVLSFCSPQLALGTSRHQVDNALRASIGAAMTKLGTDEGIKNLVEAQEPSLTRESKRFLSPLFFMRRDSLMTCLVLGYHNQVLLRTGWRCLLSIERWFLALPYKD